MLVQLPAKPIDQYRLDWFQISVTLSWYFIRKMHAIYHINTPWDKYSPNNKGGADLIDDWMIYENDCAEGRWCGWNTPSESAWHNCFLTKEEAITETRDRLIEYHKEKQNEVSKIETMIKELDIL